jgi:hypothetical protein
MNMVNLLIREGSKGKTWKFTLNINELNLYVGFVEEILGLNRDYQSHFVCV